MVMTLVGILGLFLAWAISGGIEAWNFVMDKNELMTQTPYALSRMARELRQIKDTRSVYLANSTSITFKDTDGNSITYNLVDNILYRNNYPLIDGVANFSLLYYDRNGNIISQPSVNPADTNIRKIKIIITNQKTTNFFSLETLIQPRNLSLIGAEK